jgi:hypothetical protein
MKRVIVLGLAMAAVGCGSEFSAQGSGGSGSQTTPGALGAVELQLNPPRIDTPNIGTRTSCTAGTTGTYAYFLGAASGGETASERVSSGMVPSGNGFAISCQLIEAPDAIYVTARISGRDANSRRGAAAVEFSGSIPRSSAFGALDSGTIDSDDTGRLSADPNVASCVLDKLVADEDGGFSAAIVCPALLGDDDVSGCAATGYVAFSGCAG